MEAGAQIPVGHRSSLADDMEKGNNGISEQALFNGVEILGDGHNLASPVKRRNRSRRLSRICMSEAHSTKSIRSSV